jgi:hypothetical protein
VDPVSVVMRYELSDWNRFYRFSMRRAWKVLAPCGAGFAAVAYLSSGGAGTVVGVVIPTGLIAVFLVFGQPLMMAGTMVFRSRRQPDGGAVTMRLGADGIHTASCGAFGHYPWSSLGPRIDSGDLVVLETAARRVYLLLPRRLLSADEIAAIEWWLANRDRHVVTIP